MKQNYHVDLIHVIQYKFTMHVTGHMCDPSRILNSLSLPNVINSTGEYYIVSTSFRNISCTNPNLSFINWAGGGCIQSTIDCGNSNECIVKSNSNGYGACHDTNIIAKIANQFSFDCTNVARRLFACSYNVFELNNVNSVDVTCSPLMKTLGVGIDVTVLQASSVMLKIYILNALRHLLVDPLFTISIMLQMQHHFRVIKDVQMLILTLPIQIK